MTAMKIGILLIMARISEGDDIAWNELLTYLSSHNLDNLNNYIEAATMMDMVNYIDYILAESYGGNWDWPNNNWYAASERSDEGLFRFLCLGC